MKMAKDFKLSSPLQPVPEIKNAIREARKADALTEFAVMRANAVFSVLKFGKEKGSALQIDRLDRATNQFANARAALGEAVYQLEKLLMEAGFTLPVKEPRQ